MTARALLAALGGPPQLRGALCVGRHQLFDTTGDDPASRHRQEQATAVCRTCPVLVPCARWLDSLPPHQRPLGTVAARVITTTTGGPR
ncbi:hypothetical protein EB75_02440 [Mycobacterium sp. ST-F2]|uniref:WhiB family transcriptional regulator n=1 Tax=Mycobacterium sp. ST-F2 TaxID=1490484 RepID=UPI00093B8FE2|nr:WhiB family transcriptional regulator [Mycobacterium sp. ST-F2]OKH76597.1 hypothetical protein EB75_02440 [Mycobacterium sp. ST-F2]